MKALVWMPRWLGDAVHSSPALMALSQSDAFEEVHAAVPRAQMPYYEDLGGTEALLAQDDPKLISKIRAGRYGLGLLLSRSFRSAWTLWRAGVPQRLGVKGQGRSFLLSRRLKAPPDRKLHIGEEYFALARAAGARARALGAFDELRARHPFVKSSTQGVVLHPGAAYGRAKIWPLERFEALARSLAARGLKVLALGGKGEEEACSRVAKAGKGVSAAGQTDLRGSMDLLSMASVFVGGDSGPLHLASALGRPVVGLYGSSSPAWTSPPGAGARLLWGHSACSPCFRKNCAVGYRCLKLITVEAVLAEVLRALGPA